MANTNSVIDESARKTSLRIALIQLAYRKGIPAALDAAEDFIRQAREGGADIAVLPEMFCCPYSTRKFPEYAQPEGGGICSRMADAAKENDIWLVAGSMPELEICEDGSQKIYNTSFVYRPDGSTAAKHRKVHLFDIDVKASEDDREKKKGPSGNKFFRESDTLSAGNEITVFDSPWGPVGLAVCYDIRFFEMFRLMEREGVRMIIVPGCFSMVTGSAHWELLFKSRAVDTQCFIIGCSQARDENAAFVSYSHSMIVSPWGDVIRDAGTEECICFDDIDLTETDRVRAGLPILPQLRHDVYRLEKA